MNIVNFLIGIHVMLAPLVLFVFLVIFLVQRIEDRWHIPDLAKILITLYTLLAVCTYMMWVIPFIAEKFPLS